MSDWLCREEIIGHRIVAMHVKYEALPDDLNYTRSYLTLETGLCFFPPLGFNRFYRGEVDLTGYEKLDQALPILNSPIKAVHVEIDKEGDATDGLLIELGSGLCIYDEFMAPTGIPTGLFWVPRANIRWPNYCDYWEWHASHSQDATHDS